jgi:hypothetical protein
MAICTGEAAAPAEGRVSSSAVLAVAAVHVMLALPRPLLWLLLVSGAMHALQEPLREEVRPGFWMPRRSLACRPHVTLCVVVCIVGCGIG